MSETVGETKRVRTRNRHTALDKLFGRTNAQKQLVGKGGGRGLGRWRLACVRGDDGEVEEKRGYANAACSDT